MTPPLAHTCPLPPASHSGLAWSLPCSSIAQGSLLPQEEVDCSSANMCVASHVPHAHTSLSPQATPRSHIAPFPSQGLFLVISFFFRVFSPNPLITCLTAHPSGLSLEAASSEQPPLITPIPTPTWARYSSLPEPRGKYMAVLGFKVRPSCFQNRRPTTKDYAITYECGKEF